MQTGPPRWGARRIWEFLEFTQLSPQGRQEPRIILKGVRAPGLGEPKRAAENVQGRFAIQDLAADPTPRPGAQWLKRCGTFPPPTHTSVRLWAPCSPPSLLAHHPLQHWLKEARVFFCKKQVWLPLRTPLRTCRCPCTRSPKA